MAMYRLLVNDNGDCFAKFNDKSSIFLSSSCQFVVETGKNNKQVTHIIHFINDELKKKIIQIVNVRNKYYSPMSLPLFMKEHTPKKGNKKLLAPIKDCIWSQQCQQNITDQTINSYNGNVTVRLHPNGHKMSVSFPITLNKDIKVTTNGKHVVYYNHKKQIQIQSIHNHNICWEFPLKLINDKIHNEPFSEPTLNVMHKMKLPQIKQDDTLQSTIGTISDSCLKSIEYCHCKENGLPPNEIILIEWTENIVYRIFNSPNFMVETFIDFDDSYIICSQNKQFLYHFTVHNKKYIYSMNSIPPVCPNVKQEESKYNLQDIGNKTIALLNNAINTFQYKQNEMSVFKQTTNIIDDTKIEIMSNDVTNYHIHPAVGEFTYYKDKRVRANFCDRTILELHSNWNECTIITKYGEEMKNISCIDPIAQFSYYINHSINFAKWSSLPNKDKIKYKQQQLKIQNDIQQQIEYSERLLSTQKLTEYELELKEYEYDDLPNTIQSYQNGNKDLLEGIQKQLDNIDKLLQ